MKTIIKYKNSLIAVTLYLGLSIIYTYPFISKFTSQVAGRGGDVFQNLAEINGLYNNFRELGFLKSLWSIISHLRVDSIHINVYLSYIFKQPVGYNLFWLFSFVAAGFGVYLLVKYLFENLDFKGLTASVSAFIAGLIYAFNPAHFAWAMGFRGATHIEWIPFTTLYLIKFIKKPSFRNFILIGIFSLLLVTGESHFAAYYLIFLVPLLGFYLFRNRQVFRNKIFVRYSLIALILGAFLTIWYYLPLIRVSVSEENYLNPGLDQTTYYSPDALSIITPTEFHPIWGRLFAPTRELFTGNNTTYSNYLGLTALILIIFSFFYARRTEIKEAYFWGLTGVCFFVLSLGPFLHYLGTVEPKIPLPYLLLWHYIPFFENIRAVGRIWVIALLCFSVAAAFGLKYLFDRLPRKQTYLAAVASVIVFFGVSLEYLAVPVPFTSLAYSPFYDQLKKEPGDFYVAELPGSTNYLTDAKAKYYNSIYRKKLISGLDPARKIPGRWDLQMDTPVLSEILYTLPKGKTPPRDIINHDYEKLANKIFSYYDIQYVTIQKEFVGYKQDYIIPADFEKLKSFITDNFKVESVYEDEYLIAYKIKKGSPEDFLYLTVGEGWEKLDNEKLNRRIRNAADIKIYNLYQTSQDVQISLEMESPKNTFSNVLFYYDNELISSFLSYDENIPVHLLVPDVRPGESEIEIRVNEQATGSAPVSLKNISYSIIEERVEITDSLLMLKNDASEKSVISTPQYSSYLFQEASDEPGKIFGHSLLTPEDFIIVNQDGSRKMLISLPLIKELFDLDEKKYAKLESYRDVREKKYYADNIANVLAGNNIGYLYADKKAINKNNLNKLSKYFFQYLPDFNIIDDGKFLVYAFDPPEKNTSIPFVFGDGWDILENKAGLHKRRKIYGAAALYLYSSTPETPEIQFKARTCAGGTAHFTVSLNEETADYYLTGDAYQNISFTAIRPLSSGLNQLTLTVFDNDQNTERSSCPIWVSDISVYGHE